jgi:serine protease Do
MNRRRLYRKTLVALGAAIVLVGITYPLWVQARECNEALSAWHSLSKVFTQVAQDAMPAVVFIQVEKILEGGAHPFGFNDPFDLFSDEFFERFFRRRFPEQRRPRQYRQQGQGSGFIVSPDSYILAGQRG